MKTVRFGVIGIGNMGSVHAKYLAEGKVDGAVLAAVCDRKESRLQWAKETLGDSVRLFSSSDELLNSGLVDAVLIATPHYDHPEIAIRAFAGGIHVLSEKPAGVYTKRVEDMMRAAEQSGLVFGLMFNQRAIPLHQKMHDMVQGGELGALKRLTWNITDWYRSQAYYDSGEWRASWRGEGGGVLINQCPHQLDLWQWIFGMPKKVHAFCSFGKHHNIEVEDDVTAYCEYENGATAVFITSTGDYPGTNRLEIVGDNGKLIYEHGKLIYLRSKASVSEFTKTHTAGFGVPGHDEIEITVDRENPASHHMYITQNFTGAILHGTPLLASGYEGINGLTLSNAMLLSTWTGSTVELPIDKELFHRLLQEKIDGSRYQKTVVEAVLDTENTYGTK